jgi:hypothetical protein
MITDPSVFAVLPEARRNWAVASIFGDARRLAALHAQLLQRIEPEDNLIYLATSWAAAPWRRRCMSCWCFAER